MSNEKNFWSYTQAKVMSAVIVLLGAGLVYTNLDQDKCDSTVEDLVAASTTSMASQMEPAADAGDPNVDEPVSDEPESPEDPNSPDNVIYDFLEDAPEFPGGLEACGEWIDKNLKYPSECVERNITGRVFASFVVNRDGSIGSIQVLRSPAPEMTEEVKRVLKQMPAWQPGTKNGVPVRARYTLPINFRLI